MDFLYREELEAWERQGVVKVFPAFFRQERDGVTFVQHRLWEERERTGCTVEQAAAWLREQEQRKRYLADVFGG